jgi:hypothetical protein
MLFQQLQSVFMLLCNIWPKVYILFKKIYYFVATQFNFADSLMPLFIYFIILKAFGFILYKSDSNCEINISEDSMVSYYFSFGYC